MILLLALSLLAAQVHAFGALWLGALLPDPFVCLATFAGVYWPRRSLPAAALGLGLARALVLAEPAGGQVLCAWGALLVVAGQRQGLDRGRPGAFVLAALLVAATWGVLAFGLQLLSGEPLTSGVSLLTGALLAWPLARPAHRAAALARLRS